MYEINLQISLLFFYIIIILFFLAFLISPPTPIPHSTSLSISNAPCVWACWESVLGADVWYRFDDIRCVRGRLTVLAVRARTEFWLFHEFLQEHLDGIDFSYWHTVNVALVLHGWLHHWLVPNT